MAINPYQSPQPYVQSEESPENPTPEVREIDWRTFVGVLVGVVGSRELDVAGSVWTRIALGVIGGLIGYAVVHGLKLLFQRVRTEAR